MKLSEICEILEQLAPRQNQEEWDNSGLQVGLVAPGAGEVNSVIVCLDLVEEVVDEAISKGAQLIVSHHPLIFKGLKSVSDASYQERCVTKAILNGIAIYSAHTSLDNSFGGVNHKIASLIGLNNLRWLDSGIPAGDGTKGSGLIGELKDELDAADFMRTLKSVFQVKALRHSECENKKIKTVALCGGAGAFLTSAAVSAGADCFISGEFHYHDYFSPGTILIELGHYESEQFTMDLLCDYMSEKCDGLNVMKTSVNTNPAVWLL